MPSANITNESRLALAEKVLAAKAAKKLSFEELSAGTGLSVVYVTAALLGQHPLPQDAAKIVGKRLSLTDEQMALLQTIPLRGSLGASIPSDPIIYRFYEIVQVYGTTLKVLLHEMFGDGIMSAINFKMDIKRADDPEGGSRAVITLDGKFLSAHPFPSSDSNP